MAQLISVRINKSDHQPLGFRLQGGKDFGTPLVVQKVNGGGPAERAGLQAGDSVICVNGKEVYNLRHQDAQDAIKLSGATLELTVQRGGSTWRPSVTPTGSLPRPGNVMGSVSPVTKTSLKSTPCQSPAFGSGHNNAAKPFSYMNGSGDTGKVKSIVNKQYNTPVGMYSDQSIAETLSAQTEVLAGGVLGVNFKKNEKTYDAEKSAVFKMLQENENDPEPDKVDSMSPPISGLRHVSAPVTRPDAPINNTGGLPPGQNICEECERLIVGVFVRIKDKNLHVECFKCATCGTSLKNQGYYNLNGKLYCDIHAKLVARQNPPASNLEPVTVPASGKYPAAAYTSPLPPIQTGNYTNGSSSMFSPSNKNLDTTDGATKASHMQNGKILDFTKNELTFNPSIPHETKEPNNASPIHTNNTNKTFRSVVPPHLGGNYKPASNISGPKPFGSGSSAFSPSASLSPRSAPISPAAPPSAYSNPAPPSTYSNPAPPSAYSNPAPPSTYSNPAPPSAYSNPAPPAAYQNSIKAETKNAAEDRIIKQLAKFALNGYEIGIQRKIKPGDHIQHMASQISDTVVSKHPLNLEGNSSDSMRSDSSTSSLSPPPRSRQESPEDRAIDSVLNNALLYANHPELRNNNKITVNDAISSTGEKIKETILNNHPAIKSVKTSNRPIIRNGSSNSDKSSLSPPPPPPLPNAQTLKRHDAQKANINNNGLSKQKFEPLKSDETNGYCVDNKTFDKDCKKITNGSYTNTKKNDVDGLIEMMNNSLSKNSSPQNNENFNQEKLIKNGDLKESDVRIKFRPKKKENNDSGKRDSCVIPRPVSNVASFDLVDGMYPVCNKCEKEIQSGPFITALGRIWCPEHFICVNASCRRHLQDIGFVEENGQLYCEYCFEQFIAPGCDKCHTKIKGDCLNAIGKHFHPECFSCVYCGKLFGNNPFFLEDGLPYCEADWNELFTTKCFACGFPVEAGDRWVEALNNNYHSQCFNCTMCKKNLEGQSFFAKGGRPFCKNHAR